MTEDLESTNIQEAPEAPPEKKLTLLEKAKTISTPRKVFQPAGEEEELQELSLALLSGNITGKQFLQVLGKTITSGNEAAVAFPILRRALVSGRLKIVGRNGGTE